MIDIKAIQKKCIDRHKKGFTCKQIGDRLNLDYSVVSFLLKAAGINVRNNSGKRKSRITDNCNIEKMYRVDKMTIKEIVAKLGVSNTTVSKYLRVNEIPTRGRGRTKKEERFYE